MTEIPILNGPITEVFPEVQNLINRKVCPMCKESISRHRDSLSEKEYQISGLCQKCNDETFAPPTNQKAYCDYWGCIDVGVGIMHHPHCGNPPGNICVSCANPKDKCVCHGASQLW